MTARRRAKRGLLRRAARWGAAALLVVLGLVLSIPGVPGPGFLVVALGVLVALPESRWLQRRYVRVRRRFPRAFAAVERRWRPRRTRVPRRD